MPMNDLAEFDGLGLAELVRRKQVTAAELVESAIERIECHNGVLNAVVYRAYDLARELAANQPSPGGGGPLQGVPMLLKDISGDCVGMRSTAGCRGLKDSPPSDHDSVQVARFKAAGLIPLGKTNTPEWGLLPTTEPLCYGPTKNPWNLRHSPGGSSGGSGAAVAAGMVPIAHANDAGGSIRIPASACGLVGLKPTRGRISWGPIAGEVMDGLVCEHVVTRTVRDCAAVLDATAGPTPDAHRGRLSARGVSPAAGSAEARAVSRAIRSVDHPDARESAGSHRDDLWSDARRRRGLAEGSGIHVVLLRCQCHGPARDFVAALLERDGSADRQYVHRCLCTRGRSLSTRRTAGGGSAVAAPEAAPRPNHGRVTEDESALKNGPRGVVRSVNLRVAVQASAVEDETLGRRMRLGRMPVLDVTELAEPRRLFLQHGGVK